jgi:type VI secretion system protein
MALQITLVKTPGNIALPRNNHIFDQRGGTFGRADSNTWVLPDPDKFLSSCHCAIVFADNHFYLEDKSTNGTFINGGFEPLGRGVRHQLRDGDFFEIGDYRFSIQLEQQSASPFASPFDITPAPLDNTPPFGDMPKSDFFGTASTDSPSLFDQQQDPLALWDKRPEPKPTPFDNIQDNAFGRDSSCLLDDFVGLGGATTGNNFSTMDLAPAIDQAVSWPTAKSESLIPEDWDDLLSPSSNSPGSAPQPRHDVFPQGDLASPFPVEPAITQRDIPFEVAFEVPKPAARVPLAERILGMEVPEEKLPPVRAPVPPPPIPRPPPQQVVQENKVQENKAQEIKPHVQPQVAPVSTGAGADKDSQVLIDALGLDASRLSEADKLEISRITGLLMREIVDGMLGVLRSRASIKNEFRMNVTTIQPIENNPLKFSVCVDDALENLFIKKSNAYKKPVEAFREGFQEIAEHQLAMIAGIRQGFEAMMERFNPEHLEKTFSKQVKGSVIPGMQKAKFWSSYAEYYQGFTDNMDFSFQHLFGSDFVTAYEDQLRRLTAARKRGESNNE